MARVFRPEPIRASKASVWAHAEKVATALNFAPGNSIEPLVARLGGRLLYRNELRSGGAIPESIVVRASNDFTIYLPTMTSPERDRFTIAHELGHLFLHYPRVKKLHPGAEMVATRWVDEDDKDQQRAEWEANWFAAAFLMPKAEFEKAYWDDDMEELAERFAVSVQAAEVRAKSLGLQ
ncbi:ImmA/IrrE family metallo-endopeptidase [Bradyrhizobium sp. DOA1]|uniref:ImmA/IrrE family metallo-endopeptidase n=1 Tax=Bradyrhizobium sp. DOA1 TaxID=1126616 RepID=UPI0007C68988|nr:ImmA/IrrE family metallo-endopeptidase [Bradyrhizobium sp. DOA1]